MKLAIASVAIVALFAVFVYGERCTGPMDCSLTLCSNNSKLICERQECTCQAIQGVCTSRDDCLHGDRCPNRGQEWHCIDQVCKCTY